MDLYENLSFKPMLLNEIKEPFNDKNYLFELKFDGIRAIIYAEPDKILIKTRLGTISNGTYPELLAINTIVKKKCIFDGEVVLMIDSKPNFSKLMERALLKSKSKIAHMKEHFPIVFVCFDIIYEDKDITELSLIKRKEILKKYPDTNFFVKNKYIKEKGINLFNAIKENDLEGIVAKRIDSKYYINKRTSDWLKIKNLKTEELYIGGYKEAKINSSLMIGRYENNNLIYVSNLTIGTNSIAFNEIKKQKELLDSPFLNFELKDYNYIRPDLKCLVAFIEYTKNGSLRQPVFKKLI